MGREAGRALTYAAAFIAAAPLGLRSILVYISLSDPIVHDPLRRASMLNSVMENPFPSHLSDDQLTAEVNRLARSEREATAALVAHLVEFDSRRLYLGAGCRSLFVYCTEVLHLSEHGTYNRIEASRTVRQFPVILEMLRDGSLNLATVRILAPHLTSENHRELLEAAHGRSKREVQALVARHFPQPAVPTLVRKIPVRTVASDLAGASVAALEPASGQPDPRPEGLGSSQQLAGVGPGAIYSPVTSVRAEPEPASTHPAPLRPSAPSIRPTVMPLAADRYQIRFTASAETYQKLREAQELLGHSVPSGDVAIVVDRALSALIAELTRQKLAATDRPRSGRRTSPGSRHIPAEVRRSVWERDGGRCAFVAAGGRRCSARKALEFHHVHPYGAGGDATVGNIELRCRSHNAYEADLFYGVNRNDDGHGIVRERAGIYGRALRPGDWVARRAGRLAPGRVPSRPGVMPCVPTEATTGPRMRLAQAFGDSRERRDLARLPGGVV